MNTTTTTQPTNSPPATVTPPTPEQPAELDWSIWTTWPSFPTTPFQVDPWRISPTNFSNILHSYSTSTISISLCCAKFNAEPNEFYSLTSAFPVLLKLHYSARDRRSDAEIENIRDIIDNETRDVLKAPDGRPIPNNAAVKRDELRAKVRISLIQMVSPRYRTQQASQTIAVQGDVTINQERSALMSDLLSSLHDASI